MYWHRTHKTSLRVKKTIPESMPCTMGAWYCGWGDHNLPQDTSCDIFILYCHLIFAFHRKTHLRCISSVLLHYNCKINANIQDVYHRPNLERAPKGRLPLVYIRNQTQFSYIDRGMLGLPRRQVEVFYFYSSGSFVP